MDSSSYHHSPFLSDLGDIQDPSSSTYADFNSPVPPGSPNPNQRQNALNSSVPATPFTPSFAGANVGSYTGSPRGSDISYINGNEFQSPNQSAFPGGDYPDFSIGIDIYTPDEYDPTIYDAPADTSALLFSSDFMSSLTEIPRSHSSPSLSGSSHDADVSVSVMPAPHDEGVGPYGSPFDHGSPASSNGDMDHRQRQNAARSRGSSVSSSHGPGDFSSSSLGLKHVHIDSGSPSPSWDRNPQSPPQLFIPGGMPEITHTSTSPVPSPTIPQNSFSESSGNGSLLPSGNIGSNKSLMPPDGPGIQIVPATPVSAGTGTSAAQGVPFGEFHALCFCLLRYYCRVLSVSLRVFPEHSLHRTLASCFRFLIFSSQATLQRRYHLRRLAPKIIIGHNVLPNYRVLRLEIFPKLRHSLFLQRSHRHLLEELLVTMSQSSMDRTS